MRIADVMTTPARSCAPTDNLDTAAEIMWHEDCGCVPVTDADRRAVGMITDRDICMAAHLEGRPLRACTVESVMAREVQVCHPEDPIAAAAGLMGRHRLRRLAVVDGDGHLVGIVSLNDLALATGESRSGNGGLSREAVAETLAEISRHRPNVGSAEPH